MSKSRPRAGDDDQASGAGKSRRQPPGKARSTAGEPTKRAAQGDDAGPDVVDEASDESFPASDPPAWTDTSASRDDGGC